MANRVSWPRCVPLLVGLLGACAAPAVCVHRSAVGSGELVLRLSPAALGRTLALQQTLVVYASGKTHRVDVLLEADSDAVRLALLSPGQAAAKLEWDGTQLHESRASWWPPGLRGERILSDLQLVFWPAAAVGAALPDGWLLRATPDERALMEDSEVVNVVRYLSSTEVEFENLRDGYRLRIESIPIGEADR